MAAERREQWAHEVTLTDGDVIGAAPAPATASYFSPAVGVGRCQRVRG
jgi:hypothetical protein